MNFWPPQSHKESVLYQRKMAYVEHILRSMYCSFEPLSEKQYNELCNRLEAE